MIIKRIFIKVEGIVQGVGFRPFVYNLALSNHLKGWVNNSSEGVFIDIEGSAISIERFLQTLKNSAPPLAKIENITIAEEPLCHYDSFSIKHSEKNLDKITLISPDIALCKECQEDILNPNNRRYFYPFTNCTNCGPRYSITKQLPYDRANTTMNRFKLCPACEREYKDPTNRRFHAQPNACELCGPSIYLTDNKGEPIDSSQIIFNEDLLLRTPEVILQQEKNNPIDNKNLSFDTYTENKLADLNKNIIRWTAKKLKEGFIFAIKGLTGFHLVCDGENKEAVELLRKRKNRPHKPFAVMMKDLNTVQSFCSVDSVEEHILTGIRKPILLLNKLKTYDLPEAIAPKQNTLGVMLPFTPLHELLFLSDLKVLIMTSGNAHGLPLEFENETALKNLSPLVDFFLMHNRDIYMPVDDSVSKVVLGKERLIRRARGYAPEPINFKGIKPILASGSNMKNTTCISKDDYLFLSPHNGDLENLETFEHYKRNIQHLKNIFVFKPQLIAADLHPDYFSTQYALSCNVPVIHTLHHHAHIVSCMAENNIKNKVIGLAFDGTGYGTDGKIWGGEFLICDYKDFNRAAHLNYVSMAGGERAILEPWRMGVSYLYKALAKATDYTAENIAPIVEIYGKEAAVITKMLHKNINCIETSSMGRLFDAIASIIGVCDKISYEGQASIELEALIQGANDAFYPYGLIKENHVLIIDTTPLINAIIEDKKAGTPKEILSERFHNTVVEFSVDVCKNLRALYNIEDVVLSGGVFQNTYLLTKLTKALENQGFEVYSHSKLPTNDGGLALGQIIIANEK
jgi:hydrogenase maturation protein HypF